MLCQRTPGDVRGFIVAVEVDQRIGPLDCDVDRLRR